MAARLALALALLWGAAAAAPADSLRSNAFDDPFERATAGLPGCPVPEGPLLTADEVRQQAHGRSERGTSCYQAGRCRLPNAYRYDREIMPRALRVLRQDKRFGDSSIWLLGQRRWLWVQGCVRSDAQGRAIEAALRQVHEVEAVVGQWMVGTTARPPYAVAAPQPPR
ncbi:MAG: transporter [Rubrivivax sp.]